MIAPTYLSYYVLLGSVGITATLLYGVRNALARSGWPEPDRNRVVGRFGVVLIGWFIAATGLALAGAYQTDADHIPAIQYGIALPILIGAWLMWRSDTLSRVIDAVPQAWLVGIQFYRALGVIFLILYAEGLLSGLFAWPAGTGDILVGVLAPVTAVAYARAPRTNGNLVLAWNAFGILDLIIGVGMGFATSPSPFQLAAFEQPNEILSIFPLVLIPTYLVPLSILLHLASLAKLRKDAAAARHEAENAVPA